MAGLLHVVCFPTSRSHMDGVYYVCAGLANGQVAFYDQYLLNVSAGNGDILPSLPTPPLPTPPLPTPPLTSPQPWCSLLPTAACHWLCQECLTLLWPSICRLLLQQATSQPLSCGLHTQLLHGSPPVHHLSLRTACGLRHDTDHTLHLLWPIQVTQKSHQTTHTSHQEIV